MDAELLALAPMWYVAFLLSLTCHEAAHALVAQWGGDPTAASGGQVSLNPVPHIQREPIGTVVVPLVSMFMWGWMMGWASAPVDPYWQQRHPHRAAWVALAGPAANLSLAILAGLLIHAGIAMDYFAQPESVTFRHVIDAPAGGLVEASASFISILFSLNLLLMVFNLVPVPPLDGSTAIGLLVSESTALRIYEFMRQPGVLADRIVDSVELVWADLQSGVLVRCECAVPWLQLPVDEAGLAGGMYNAYRVGGSLWPWI